MNQTQPTSGDETRGGPATVEMPRPTAAPLILSLAIALLAAGVATNVAFTVVGAIVFVVGLGMWIGQLLPGRGHCHEPLVEPARRPSPVMPTLGTVERLRAGMPGYRLRLPEKVHPISAGIRGGLVGGLVMPLPAALYGLLSGRGIWLPLNLLAGMVIPGLGELDETQLEQFDPTLTLVGTAIHVTTSLVFGLLYGVLMPTLPDIKKPLAWAALLMPILWTAASFILISTINPIVRERIEWPWFIVSQFIFGMVLALVVLRFSGRHPVVVGLAGGAVAGILMPLPAALWGHLSGHGIWYPINLLAAMIQSPEGDLAVSQLEQFNSTWLLTASLLHIAFSISFGLLYGLLLARLPEIPGPLAWGGLVMPLFWTASSYGLMGVVNPLLQQRVDWPWFIASQFVFGLVAAIVVVRSEEVHIPPAGRGSDEQLSEWVAGDRS